MNFFSKKILVFPFILFSLLAQGQGVTPRSDSLRYEILLNTKIIEDINLNGSFINSFDVTYKQLILLSTADQFYLLGWGGILPIGQNVGGTVRSFAYTPDSLLMVIRNNALCTFDTTGKLSALIKLPSDGMGISAGKYAMYIYDRNKEKEKNAIYIIVQGGKYAKLLEVSSPVNSVAEIGNSLLFATGSALFSYELKNKKLRTLVALPADKVIQSVAVDTSGNSIFFSTGNAVYGIKDSNVIMITEKFGGTLRLLNDGLIVYNPDKKFMIRILHIGEVLARNRASKPVAHTEQATDRLTNATIINLVKTKLSDDLIIKLINSNEVNFDLGVDATIELASQNVSSAVIMAMRNAMKRKNNK